MNNLIKFSNEIANTINYTNIQNSNWKSPIQEQENKIEEIYQQFIQSQKTYNFVNIEWKFPKKSYKKINYFEKNYTTK